MPVRPADTTLKPVTVRRLLQILKITNTGMMRHLVQGRSIGTLTSKHYPHRAFDAMRKWFTLCSWPQWVSAGVGRLWEESRIPRDGWADCTDEQLMVSDATVQNEGRMAGFCSTGWGLRG